MNMSRKREGEENLTYEVVTYDWLENEEAEETALRNYVQTKVDISLSSMALFY